jgi:hypothetical protein
MSSPFFLANAVYNNRNDNDTLEMFGMDVKISSFSYFKGKYPFRFNNLWIKLNMPRTILDRVYERRNAILGSSVPMQYLPHVTLASLQFCNNYPLTSSNPRIQFGSIGKIMETIATSYEFKVAVSSLLVNYHRVKVTNIQTQGYAMLGDSEIKYLAKCFASEISNIGEEIAQIFAREIIRCYAKQSGWTLKIRHKRFICQKEYMGFYVDFVDNTTGTHSSISQFPAFVMPMYYYVNDSTCHITIASSQEIQMYNPELYAQMEPLSQEIRGTVASDFLVCNTCFDAIPTFRIGDCAVVVDK